MEYVLHKAADLGPQVHTCCRHSDPSLPCAPQCVECAGLTIEQHMDRLYQACEPLRTAWKQKYKAEYERLTQQKRSGELTSAVLVKAHLELQLAGAKGEVEDLTEQLKQFSSVWRPFEKAIAPLIDASIALEKECDYLHPYSAAVSDKVSAFRAAVLQFLKLDAEAGKS